MSTEEKLRKAILGLGVIAGTEACVPPQFINGNVVQPDGFSKEGHKACVRRAFETLIEIGAWD